MRILFLCSSLEPGRDGVGDHVRLLAEACERQGHTCALLALRDPHCQKIMEGGAEGEFPYLRLPSVMDSPLEQAAVIEFRDRFSPDWISLQLVAYGLNPKGLLFDSIPVLRGIIGALPLHLMLHEIWLGNHQSASWRHRVMGFLQRTSLRKLISVLRPRVVATSNSVYAADLRTIGVEAEIVPLFGNIPVAAYPQLPAALAQAGITTDTRRDWWIGLFFGGLYPEWKAEPFLSVLLRAAAGADKRVCLVLAGNAGTQGEKVWAELERAYALSVSFLQLRAQPETALSVLMQAADFGVAATPWSLIGKSGSAAAMLDHGLPVIVTRDDFKPRSVVTCAPSQDPLLHRCDDALEAKLIAGLPRRQPRARVDEVATIFLHELERAENTSRRALEVSP